MSQNRGELTDRIKKKSEELFGSEITTKELRLLPYLMYVMMNEQRLDPNKINEEERKILRKWKDAGYIEGGASGMLITEEFWKIMTEIIFLGYVDID